MKTVNPGRLCPRLMAIIYILTCLSPFLYGQTADKKTAESQKQSDLAAILEEKIRIYNRDFCPPRLPVAEISEVALLKLVAVDLISRGEVEKFRGMQLVDGKIVKSQNGSQVENQLLPGNNLVGELVAACDELKENKTRGQSEGSTRPEKTAKLKPRKVQYRDSDNQLREMEVYSPPKLKAKKKKKVKGKKGKKVKDYATSRMLEKNREKEDSGKFNSMPSADSWVGED